MKARQRDGGLLAKTEFNGIGGIAPYIGIVPIYGTPPCTFGLSSPRLGPFLSLDL
jgi:hypothetical protein